MLPMTTDRNPRPADRPAASLRQRIAAALTAVLLLASACVPADAQLLGGDEETLGAREHPKILAQFGGAYRDQALQSYVDRIGRKLAAQTGRAGPWTFTVLDSDVVNAFALPGGYVYITRGLIALAKDEAEVASVLGHEIGHVVAQHSRERQTQQTIAGLLAAGAGILLGSPELAQVVGLGGNAVLARYSRGQESEADRLGIDYLEGAGYDPFAMATFLETMRRESQLQGLRAGKGGGGDGGFDFFATHPRTESRVQEAAAIARQRPPGGARPQAPYLAAVDGMVFGDSPENGFVRGRSFVHPVLGIAFDAPPGYSLLNGSEAVIAKGPDGGAILFEEAGAEGGRDPAAHLARLGAQGVRLQGVQPLTVNGLPAATAVTQGETDGGAVDVRLVVIGADRLYRFTFLAPRGALARFDPAFQQTAASFRRLGPQEAARIQPRRLRVVTARPGDGVESFVRRMPPEAYAEELFRIINDLPPGTPIEAGRKVKIVEG